METAVQWEYHILQVPPRFVGGADLARLEVSFADLGRQGWELVSQLQSVGGQSFIFLFKCHLGPSHESHKDTDS